MKQEKKQMYVAPAIEVIKMENEGVIAASGGSLGDLIDGGSAFSTGRSGRGDAAITRLRAATWKA